MPDFCEHVESPPCPRGCSGWRSGGKEAAKTELRLCQLCWTSSEAAGDLIKLTPLWSRRPYNQPRPTVAWVCRDCIGEIVRHYSDLGTK